MNEDFIVEIKKMNKLLALSVTKDLQQNEKIEMLSNSGYKPKEIADLIGISNNAVSVSLNRIKKRKK